MNKIRRNDEVVVLAGREKGARGTISRVILDASGRPERVVVDGLNLVSRHTRPNPQKNDPGGVVKREAPMHASNVALYNPETARPERVRIRRGENGKSVRVFVKSGKEVA